MAFFSKEVIENFSELEKIRNIQLEKYNLELERICKMPEDERINQMDKMRILLRLRELYEELDIKVVEGNMIFFKGKAVVSTGQLDEIMKLQDKCFVEEENYYQLIQNDEFVLSDNTRLQLNDYITIREIMLQGYITNSINSSVPNLSPRSTFFMNSEEYINLIKLFSELKIAIKDNKVYVNEKAIKTNAEYINLIEKISKINKISIDLMKKIKP